MAPWDWVTEPYFSVGMGYIYKETTMEEAQRLVNFKIFQPLYRPFGSRFIESRLMSNLSHGEFRGLFLRLDFGTDPARTNRWFAYKTIFS